MGKEKKDITSKYTGVRKRANAATWSYRFKKTQPDGEIVVQELGGFKTALEASKARTKALSDLEETGTYAEDRRKRFSTVFKEFIDRQGSDRAYATIKRYNSLYENHFKKPFGDKFIFSITTEQLESFLSEKARPYIDRRTGQQKVYSSEYLNGFWKFLKVTFDYALKAGYIKKNPVITIKKDKDRGVKKEGGQVIEPEMLAQLSERFQSTNLYPAFYISSLTGMRCSEVFGLLWNDIDFEEKTININKQLQYQDGLWTLSPLKTEAAERVIKINENLFIFLVILYEKQQHEKRTLGDAYRDNHKTRVFTQHQKELIKAGLPFVNIKSNGERLTPDSCKVLARISKADLGYSFKFHNLRHTFITNCTMMGMQPESLRKYVGHNKISTTHAYYVHESEEMKVHSQDIIDRLEIKEYKSDDLALQWEEDKKKDNDSLGGNLGGQFKNGMFYED